MATALRVADNLSHYLAPGYFDTPLEPVWNDGGTIDIDATTTELEYLAKVVHAVGLQSSEPYRAAFPRGIQYLLDAQFPNGGWPPVWPAILRTDESSCALHRRSSSWLPLVWRRKICVASGAFQQCGEALSDDGGL